ncbi:hypothetical protein JX265_004786 [Neoarthrinium moseri]|uniref:Uncharacterized protein n=1 Tax=Neoarthrinium moseri TaxID=1658444 RepID=A0A9P9WQE0_9PEZI|nr:hypothetical protein JX265_004786 [Neoarthrinium moseri]
MRASAIVATAAAIASTAYAAPSATIFVETKGVAGGGFGNVSITVPIDTVYTNQKALSQVGTLYLTAADGVPVQSVTCTPYQGTDGTGSGGKPFTFGTPSRLSTNVVQVGSIVCKLTSSTTSIGGTTTSAGITLPAPTTTPFANPDATDRPAATGTGTGSTGSGSGGNGNGNAGTTLATTATTATASTPSDTSTPAKGGAIGRDLPDMMSALVLGAVGLIFAM